MEKRIPEKGYLESNRLLEDYFTYWKQSFLPLILDPIPVEDLLFFECKQEDVNVDCLQKRWDFTKYEFTDNYIASILRRDYRYMIDDREQVGVLVDFTHFKLRVLLENRERIYRYITESSENYKYLVELQEFTLFVHDYFFNVNPSFTPHETFLQKQD